MICRKCKKEAPDGAFCIFCGARQEKSRSAPRKRGNGQGCAYKRGNTWYGVAPGYSYCTEENGKKTLHRIRPTKGGFATKKEALEWAVSASAIPQVPVPKMIELWEGWSKNDMLKLSKNKQTSYKIARKRIESIIAYPIDVLTVDDLQKVINTECDTYYPARDVKSLLSHLYKRAMASNANRGRVTQNLSEFLILPEMNEKEAVPLTEQEVTLLWKSYEAGDSFVGYILLLIYSGMMPGELMICKKDMVDLENCEIRGAGAKTKVRKKSAIVFPDFLKPVVESLLNIRSTNSNAKNDKLLTMNKDNFYEYFYAAIEKAGIDNPKNEDGEHRITPYSCRHTYGTEAVKMGAHPAVIQKMLRHSNTKTQEKYTHLGSEEVHSVANLMKKK
ncbi:MAG: tyrosine-type recombinase/integrase [Oscillospiraceae bacterium]|nr:tyrosine-type recombinase/integrase [Oscillospiraceae bacterium]